GITTELVVRGDGHAHQFDTRFFPQTEHALEATPPSDVSGPWVVFNHPAKRGQYRVQGPVHEAILRSLARERELKLAALLVLNERELAGWAALLGVPLFAKLPANGVMKNEDVLQDRLQPLEAVGSVLEEVQHLRLLLVRHHRLYVAAVREEVDVEASQQRRDV